MKLLSPTVGLNGITGCEDELVKCVPGFSKPKLVDLQSGILTRNLESPFPILLHKMGQTLLKAKAIAKNSFEDLDPVIVNDLKSKLKNFLNIGPFHLISPPTPSSCSDVHDCMPWLDQQKHGLVAYIAFGTVMKPQPHELKSLAEALESSKTPFLCSLKDKFRSNLPEVFLERTKGLGKIAPWVPQVLSHSALAVFITHCGGIRYWGLSLPGCLSFVSQRLAINHLMLQWFKMFGKLVLKLKVEDSPRTGRCEVLNMLYQVKEK